MDGIKKDSPSARLIAEALGDEPFTLIDIGCSGGIDAGWSVFGDRLRAFAFDASLPEIARLRAEAPRPGIEYLAARVGLPPGGPLDHETPGYNWWRRNPWERLAAARAAALREGPAPLEATCAARWAWPGADPLRVLPPEAARLLPAIEGTPAVPAAAPPLPVDLDHHRTLMAENRWGETLTAPDHAILNIPAFLAGRSVRDIDFVKIDVDGPDYAILISLDALYRDAPILGVAAEVNFFGSDSPHHHSFHNTDRYMRGQGFDLFGLTVRKYASAALPRKYIFTTIGESATGRPIQGEALYARDTGWKGEADPCPALSPPKLLKLAALFALFDLPDQAAEVLVRHRAVLAERLDVSAALDALTEEAWPGSGLGHADLIARFEAGDPVFFPSDG